MSFISSVLQWGLKAATSDQAKQAELKAIQAGMQQVSTLLQNKVPDYYEPVIAPLLSQVASHAVAAIMSKTH